MAARFIYEGKSVREKRVSRLATMSREEKLPTAAAGWQATGGCGNGIISNRVSLLEKFVFAEVRLRSSYRLGVLMKSDKKRYELLISVTLVTAL